MKKKFYYNKYTLLNNFRLKLKNNKPVIGSWLQIPNSTVAELFSESGYEFVNIDLEHGSIFLNDITELIRSIEKHSSLPFVRIQKPDKFMCKKAIEEGAAGLIIPMISDYEVFEDIALNVIYPPIGLRSVGYSRTNSFGNKLNFELKNFKPFLVCMIENIKIVSQLDKLLSNKFLDAVLIGPYDLSASIGKPGKFENIEYKKIVSHILLKSKKYNVPCGIHIINPSEIELKKNIKKGFRFLPYSIDTIFIQKSIKVPKI